MSLFMWQWFQDKVFQELFTVFGTSDRLPTKNDLAQLTYLDCVIRESLRLYPVVPVIGRVLAEDAEMGNKILLSLLLRPASDKQHNLLKLEFKMKIIFARNKKSC